MLTKSDVSIGAIYGFFFTLIFAWMQVNLPEYRWFASIYITSAVVCWLVFGMEWVTRTAYPVWEVWGYRLGGFDLLLGIVVAFFSFIVARFMGAWFGQAIHPLIVYMVAPTTVWNLLIVGVSVPFYEETLFLGIIPPTVKGMVGEVTSGSTALLLAAIIGSGVFAAFHWMAFQPMQPMIISAFIFRLLTIFIANYRGGIGFAIVSHIIINTLSVLHG